MSEQRIEPHKITKPISLLAAWLVGLVLIDGIFLFASTQFNTGSFEMLVLIIAAIFNVPLFIIAIFLLQTKYRPELQEDTYYSDYINRRSGEVVKVEKITVNEARLDEIDKRLNQIAFISEKIISRHDATKENLDWTDWSIGVNRHHPEFETICNELGRVGVPIGTIFPSTKSESYKPVKWIIALSRYLPIEHKMLILKTLMPYKFDGFTIWEPLGPDDGEPDDVYIGSYGNDSYVVFDDRIDKLLKLKINKTLLNQFFNENAIPYQGAYTTTQIKHLK